MKSVVPGGGEGGRRKRLSLAIRQSLRGLQSQLSLLNRQVGARADLKDVDLDCVDIISRDGPISPSALARVAKLHPATMTGIIDRLERDGWVVRERDPTDRRAVLIRALPDRQAGMVRLYSTMNVSMDQICADYEDAELKLIDDFLRRTTAAGRAATEELIGD